MDADEPGWAIIDDFFRAESADRAAPTVRRYLRARVRLYEYLDTADMTPGLGADASTLLQAERQFTETGAFWTLFGADDLACCLPGFVDETWWPAGLADTRTQVSLTTRLLRWCGGPRSAQHAVDVAVAQARSRLAARTSAPAARPQLPERFRRRPGPRW
jgi:hypothetical protein